MPSSTINSSDDTGNVPKIYPVLLEPLEFKLLKPQPQINKSVRYEQENMQPSQYVYPSSSSLRSNYDNQSIFATNLRDRNRPMLNLTNLFDKPPIHNEYNVSKLQGPYERNNIRH